MSLTRPPQLAASSTDGRADHTGGALLTSGAFGHIESIEEKRRGQARLQP
jgi:hypothetical protein